MAEIVLKNVKKIYPNAESKSVYPGGGESVPKEASLQITEEGVVAVQDFSHRFQTMPHLQRCFYQKV